MSSEMLRPGDVRVITGGRDLIHALFHLERPTASIVVRTEGEADVTPQLDYWPPAVATDDDAEEPWQRRLAQLTDLLVTTEDPSIERRLTHVMREEDLATCFLVLRRALRHRDARVLGRLLATLGGRDADAARAFDAALGEMKRVGSLVARRAQLVDPSTRLLLAVLLNAPDRRTLLELFASIDPSRSPVEALVDALRIASSVEAPLQFRGVAWSPNVLGLPSPVEGWEEALRAELEGRDGLSRSPAVEAYLAALRAAPSLAPLFRV